MKSIGCAEGKVDKLIDAAIAARYGGAVPRYTSYPTAPHFSEDIDAARHADWLATVGAGDDVSLYMHVPFCREMCWYCGCFTKIVRKYEPVAGYVETLLAEIELVAGHLSGRAHAPFLHWGGGSPTILTAADWHRIRNHLDRFFDVPADAEIAVEMDPRTTTREYADALAHIGVNRVSIGVQEFDPDIQRAINRVQPFETTARVVEWIRRAGVTNLNLDLMYGLPGQNLDHIEKMTRRALTLKPQRIALFGYAHVPWMKTHQRMIDDNALPGTEERWHQACLASEVLEAAGFVRVGFDHFALPDDPLAGANGVRVSRNFQGYTTDNAETLIGFGASAISSLPQGYVQNVASLRSYAEAVDAGRLPAARGVALSADDKLRRFIIERIMCDMGVDVGEACRQFGFPANELDPSLDGLSAMVGDGLIALTGRSLVVNERARPLVRNIAVAFDAYFADGAVGHSSAV